MLLYLRSFGEILPSNGGKMRVSAKISGMGMFLLGSVFAYGSMQDRLARFSTPGPDCYTDGTIVVDGATFVVPKIPDGPS